MLKVVHTLHLQAWLLSSVWLCSTSCLVTRFTAEEGRGKEKPRPHSRERYTHPWTIGRSSLLRAHQDVQGLLHQGYSKRENMAIQSCQMDQPNSWKIIFLHALCGSIVSLKDMQDRKGLQTIFTQRSWQYRSNQTRSIIQTQTILFAVVLYPWLIIRVMHDWMDIILWTPANWSRTINRSSKMIPLPPTVGFALRCWVQRTGDRRANERCRSAQSRLKRQQR